MAENFEPIQGKDKILFFRLLKDATEKKASKILYQVEHTISYSNETEEKQTKDGSLQQSGGLSTTINLNAVVTNDETNRAMRDAVKSGDVIELWEVDLQSMSGDGECDALYMRGKLNSWEDPANVTDYAEFSTTVAVIGEPKEGKVQLTKEQHDAIQYTFRNLEEVSESEASADAEFEAEA